MAPDKNRPAVTAVQLSVVVPVYNEGENIGPLAREISGALTGRVYHELIFVDDGSVDNTPDQIRHEIELNPAISVHRHDVNRGQSAAVRMGVLAARADLVVVLDGDGQNDPADIPRLYDHFKKTPGLNMVIGERLARKDNWLRRASSRVANTVRSRLLGDGMTDTGCGLKIFCREQYLGLPAFDHMHRFLPALFQLQGGKVQALPVNHRPRLYGQSKYGVRNRLWVGVMDMLGVRWLQKRRL